MILGFVPFILFALLANLSQDLALWTAFAAAFALALRDFGQHRGLRLFDTGSLAVFGAVAFFAGFLRPGLSVAMTRLIVDLGFCGLALLSLLLRNPLTLQEVQDDARRKTRGRRFSHYALTALWVVAFAAMAAADGFANTHKYLPQSLDGAAGLTVLLVGLAITSRATAPSRDEHGRTNRLSTAPLVLSRATVQTRDTRH
jgi:hypothetical protein